VTVRDERVPPIDPEGPTERKLVALQRRLTRLSTQADAALAERNDLLVEMNGLGWTHKYLAGLLSAGQADVDFNLEPLTIACVGRAVRRTRPDSAVDGRKARYARAS